MAFVALLVVGAIATSRIPLQLFPSGFRPNSLSIDVELPDSTPSEVEEKIARPLERVLGTISGIKKIRCTSFNTRCYTRVEFDGALDPNEAYQQVWDRLDRVAADFPEEARKPRVRQFDPDDIPVAFIGISVKPGTDEEALRDPRRQNRIEGRLMRNPGVAQVQILGNYAETVDIDLQRDQVEGLGINLYELVQKLSRDNFSMGGGTTVDGGANSDITSVARFASYKDLLDYPVRDQLKLKGIARVGRALALENNMVRINGERAVLALVNKRSGANILEVANAVRRTIEVELAGDPLLADLDFHLIWDQGRTISGSLQNLGSTLWQGALVAVLVLAVFLRDWRMTSIITLAIPISLLATLVAMYFLGETLNIVSLMGITLGVGMLVDNSIVVVESIQGRYDEAGDAHDAALVGTGRVALGMLISTLTTIAVFLPLMIASDAGLLRFLLIRLGLPVCLSLAASLVVAMVLIPPAARFLLVPSAPLTPSWRRPHRYVDQALAWTIRVSTAAYGWLLEVALARRLEVVVGSCLLFAGSFYFLKLKETDLNEGEDRDLSIGVQLPDHYTLRQARDEISRIEQVLLAHKAELDIASMYSSFGATYGNLRIFLTDLNEQTLTREEAIKRIRALVPTLAGAKVRVGDDQDAAVQRASHTIVLEGRDTDTLVAVARDLRKELARIEGVHAVDDPFDEGQAEVILRLDRELTSRYGIDPQVAVGMISYSFRGRYLPALRVGDREIYVRIRMDRADEPTVDEVAALLIPTSNGTRIPLGTVARFERARASRQITREDRRTVLSLTCQLEPGQNAWAMGAFINARLARYQFPDGYGFQQGDREREKVKQDTSFYYGAALAVFLVFFLMGFLFESWLLPLAILFSIPFAFSGAWFALWLTDTPADAMVYLGLIVLIGVVVNNGVVMVERVQQLRAEGRTRHRALVLGSAERFRPILMTALTTIGGLIPMAWGGSSSSGIPYFPLGRTVIGGLTASTALTLFVIPVMYTMLDDLARAGRRLVAKFGRGGR